MDKLIIEQKQIEILFHDLVNYFGEDTYLLNSDQFFAIINDFINKFEVCLNICIL